jgi:protein O-GlcNAc transferase
MLSLLGEHDRALSVYARHEALAPLGVRSYITKGAELWSVRRYDEALVAFEAAVSAGGNTPLLWTNLGLALAKVKRSEEALAAFDRALALDPHYVDAAVQRARTLLRLRRFKEGRAAVTHAADLRVEQRHARHLHAHE